jgi:hypothetical protein
MGNEDIFKGKQGPIEYIGRDTKINLLEEAKD